MVTHDKFESTVSALQEAALYDAHWSSAAALINELTGAKGHALGYGGPHMPDGSDVSIARFYFGAERRRDLERLYFSTYGSRDEAVPVIRRSHNGELLRIADLYTDRQKKTSPVYNEFLRKIKGQDGIRIRLNGQRGWHVVMSFADSVEAAGWTSGQIELIKALQPHVRHLFRVRHVLLDALALDRSMAELLENTRLGVIQLDRRGRIVEANDRAGRFLRDGDGLTDENGALICSDSEDTAELLRLLACALPTCGVERIGGSMTITRPPPATRLICSVHPVRQSETDCAVPRIVALVLVVDPESRCRIDPEFLSAVFGLTPAEGRVAAALADGAKPADIASATSRAEDTVRRHIQRIYRKMRINRSTELVRRVLSLEGLTRACR